MKEVKIVVLGSGGVGKSALTIQLVHNVFVDRYDPTIEDSYRKVMTVDGETFSVELVDTAGTEQFMSLHSLYIKSGDGFALVFSLASIDSVNELSSIRQQIVRIKEAEGLAESEVPVVLVGNKCDLVEERQVPRDVGIGLSGLWGGVPYYETSARKVINVEEVFQDILRQMMRREGQRSRSNSSPSGGRTKRKHRCLVL